MPYLAVKWDNENNDVAVSGMYQVKRNKVVEYNGAGKSILPMLDLDGISNGSEAIPVFYHDGSVEQSIGNTNPGSYIQQEGLFATNPDVLTPYEAKHYMDAVDATKSARDNPTNHNSGSSNIEGTNKTNGNIKGSAVLGSNVDKNNKEKDKKQGYENKDKKESRNQESDSDEGDNDNGVKEITLLGTIFTGIIFICLM
jgi:hypothetical protein